MEQRDSEVARDAYLKVEVRILIAGPKRGSFARRNNSYVEQLQYNEGVVIASGVIWKAAFELSKVGLSMQTVT